MILNIILPVFETIINRAVQCDPDTAAKITSLNNQVIEINCTDWRIQFFMICTNSEFQFEKKYAGTVHTTITGTLPNFLQIFMKGADTKSIFKHPIEISGNMDNMTILRDSFKNIDIDWEEKLSRVVGDVLAHEICFYAKDANKTLKNTAKKAAIQAKEYIYFEGRNLPSKQQVENLYADIARLRDDAERAEKRVMLLFYSNSR